MAASTLRWSLHGFPKWLPIAPLKDYDDPFTFMAKMDDSMPL